MARSGMTSDLDTPVGLATSNLNEVARNTSEIESKYQVARDSYLEAATALRLHGLRFSKRKDELEALGHQSTYDPPCEVDLVTQEEVDAAIAARGW